MSGFSHSRVVRLKLIKNQTHLEHDVVDEGLCEKKVEKS